MLEWLTKISGKRTYAFIFTVIALFLPGITHLYFFKRDLFLIMDFPKILAVSVIYSLYPFLIFFIFVQYLNKSEINKDKTKDLLLNLYETSMYCLLASYTVLIFIYLFFKDWNFIGILWVVSTIVVTADIIYHERSGSKKYINKNNLSWKMKKINRDTLLVIFGAFVGFAIEVGVVDIFGSIFKPERIKPHIWALLVLVYFGIIFVFVRSVLKFIYENKQN